MWHLAIPYPNWTGFFLGFVVAFLVFFAWGIWLNRRERKRHKVMQQKTFRDMMLHVGTQKQTAKPNQEAES